MVADLPGWTRDDVLDQIDLPFLCQLNKVWLDAPPVRLTQAAAIGYKRPEPTQYLTARDARELQKRFGGKMPGVPQLNAGAPR